MILMEYMAPHNHFGNRLSLEKGLGALRYPGFAYMNTDHPHVEPEDVLFSALVRPDFEARVAEALPWLVYNYADHMDWDSLTKALVKRGRQNRLGFVVELANELAANRQDVMREEFLHRLMVKLQQKKLDKEMTLCMDSVLEFAKKRRRSKEASHWNIWSTLNLSDLQHVQ